MQKIILFFILFTYSLFANTSIYPLPIVFDDNGFMPFGIYSTTDNKPFQLSLRNYNDKLIYYQTQVDMYYCKKTISFEEFLNIKKDTKCYKAINMFHPKLEATFNINGFKILTYSNNVKELESYVFNDNKFIAKLGYNGKNKDFFYNILRSIRINKNIKPIDFYIKKAKNELNTTNVNTLTRYTFGALLLNSKDKRIKPLIKNIVKLRDINTKMINKLTDKNSHEQQSFNPKPNKF